MTSSIRFEPVARRTVSEEVRDAITARIHTRGLAPGSQMPSERALCEQFGVARTSVREAIQGLVSLGLLERRANRSYVVEHLPEVHFNLQDRRKRRVRELFEVRQIVEIPIARLATCHANDEERARIVAIASTFEPQMQLEIFRERDREFHETVARACGNATLAELYGKVLESLFQSQDFEELLSARTNRRVVSEIIRSSSKAHKSIAQGIADHDWAFATEAAERHLDQVEDQMISKMV